MIDIHRTVTKKVLEDFYNVKFDNVNLIVDPLLKSFVEEYPHIVSSHSLLKDVVSVSPVDPLYVVSPVFVSNFRGFEVCLVRKSKMWDTNRIVLASERVLSKVRNVLNSNIKYPTRVVDVVTYPTIHQALKSLIDHPYTDYNSFYAYDGGKRVVVIGIPLGSKEEVPHGFLKKYRYHIETVFEVLVDFLSND